MNMLEESLIAAAILLTALVGVWGYFHMLRVKRRKTWQSKRPIHVKLSEDGNKHVERAEKN
jgi:hypothetical protein